MSLYCALIMMKCKGELESCHVSGLSLHDALIALLVFAHRIHDLPFTSSFITAETTSWVGYRDESRNFIPETRIGNRARGGYNGAVFLNNLCNAVPWLLGNADTAPKGFSSAAVEAITVQLQEVLDDPTELVKGCKLDAHALVGSGN